MRALRCLLCLSGLLLILAACNRQASFDASIPRDQSVIATQILSELSNRDYPSVESRLAPGINTASAHDELERMAGMFPSGTPREIKIVGANTSTVNGVTTYSLTLEDEYPNTWLLANMALQKHGDRWTILGLHVYPMRQSLETENRFTFKGKTAGHYIVFALAVAIPFFVAFTLVACFRTPIAKRKWRWLLFVAIGIVQFSFNWTNGAVRIQPITFELLGSGYFRASPYAPVILNFSVPVGAIVFWLKRWSKGAGNDERAETKRRANSGVLR